MPKSRRLYNCTECSFTTTEKEEKWIHARLHIQPEKQLKCQMCNFITKYRHHYEYHVRTHTGTKPYKCEHCDYQCINKSMLNSHVKSHSSIREYECKECKYATKYAHSLNNHRLKYGHIENQSKQTHCQDEYCILDLRVNSKSKEYIQAVLSPATFLVINESNYLIRSHNFQPTSQMHKIPPKLRLKLANECDSLLTRAKLKPTNAELNYYLVHSQNVDPPTLDKLKKLFEDLMRELYERSSWGWNEQEKLAEWKHSRTRIILVTKGKTCDTPHTFSYNRLPPIEEEVIGFMCFRFEIGADKNECALYVYELHIKTEYQRQGLGAELMRMAKIIGTEFKMDKIMLTSFNSNTQALKFYKKLKFNTDKSSPASNEADYTILSSKLKT